MSGRFDRPEIFYSFTSPLVPTTVYRYDAGTKRSIAFEPPKLTFDPSRYETTRVFYTSKDGTRVPMFITRTKGLDARRHEPDDALRLRRVRHQHQRRRSAPTCRRGSSSAASGPTANMRGGGEYGEAWHEAGMLEKKQNVFDDFIAAAEYLDRSRSTRRRQKLGISGGSNGGLLVGAVMEQRPDLFAVALPAVGVMDMLRYHKFTGGAAWATEYGSADDSDRSSRTCAPTRRCTTSRPARAIRPRSSRRPITTTASCPSHSFKFTAALQKAQGCANPVLIRVETGGSHGYRPTDKRIAELADEWAFAAAQMGVKVGAMP